MDSHVRTEAMTLGWSGVDAMPIASVAYGVFVQATDRVQGPGTPRYRIGTSRNEGA